MENIKRSLNEAVHWIEDAETSLDPNVSQMYLAAAKQHAEDAVMYLGALGV